jgi:hypothetical protein
VGGWQGKPMDQTTSLATSATLSCVLGGRTSCRLSQLGIGQACGVPWLMEGLTQALPPREHWLTMGLLRDLDGPMSLQRVAVGRLATCNQLFLPIWPQCRVKPSNVRQRGRAWGLLRVRRCWLLICGPSVQLCRSPLQPPRQVPSGGRRVLTYPADACVKSTSGAGYLRRLNGLISCRDATAAQCFPDDHGLVAQTVGCHQSCATMHPRTLKWYPGKRHGRLGQHYGASTVRAPRGSDTPLFPDCWC